LITCVAIMIIPLLFLIMVLKFKKKEKASRNLLNSKKVEMKNSKIND
jgi:hypothetical protein